ncbi:hypothetical protein [Roseivivax sp. CAU 1761]
MSLDVFAIGLAALVLIAALIVAATSRSRETHDGRERPERRTSSLARDGRFR